MCRRSGGNKGAQQEKGIIISSTGKEMIIINWEQVSVRRRIESAMKTAEFVSDRLSYIVLRGRWRNIILANVHAESEEKSEESKDSIL